MSEIVEVPIALKMRRLAIVRRTLNCLNADDLGLGTCQCESHKTYKTRELDLEEFLKILKEELLSGSEIKLRVENDALTFILEETINRYGEAITKDEVYIIEIVREIEEGQ